MGLQVANLSLAVSPNKYTSNVKKLRPPGVGLFISFEAAILARLIKSV